MAGRQYSCDVCGKRFRVSTTGKEQDEQITCPRCRVPFVRPLARKGRKTDALRQITLYHGLSCG